MLHHTTTRLSLGRRTRLETLRRDLLIIDATESMRGSVAPALARIEALLSGEQEPVQQDVADVLPRISAILEVLPAEQSALRRGLIQCEGAIRSALGLEKRERMTAHRGRELVEG